MQQPIDISFHRLNHLQLCIPRNEEPAARKFYCDLLGLEEIDKPQYLRKNGGFWLRIADIELHIGAEDVVNRSKRHPAFEISKINTVKQELSNRGVKIKEDRSLPLYNRFSFYDPFNNRIELLEAKTKEELEFLGQEVTVNIDRPLGSRHPEYELEYPVNYGVLADTVGIEGRSVDAYVLGTDKPLSHFSGVVKAVIIRYNDGENKLVVTPSDYQIEAAGIIEATLFHEKFFNIEIRLMEI